MAIQVTALDDLLGSAADAGDVPGVSATIATDDGVIYEGGFGSRELGKPDAYTADTVVWIASMTKAITAAAAMQLVEAGRIGLDTPASDVLAQLGNVEVLDGFDDAGEPKLRAPIRPVTLRHLLTHTAGYAYDIWNTDLARFQELRGIPGITGCENAALATPLIADPGDRWNYGINIDWAGKLVEAVSGFDLETYMSQMIFGPLGMTDTSFKLWPHQRERLATVHTRGDDGSLTPFPFEIPQEPEFHMGGGGLYSTVGDYVRFTRAILGLGTLDGNQILKPETVQQMAANNMGDINTTKLITAMAPFSKDADFYPGMAQKWGLSFLINTETTPQGRSAGSLAWAGLANSYYWFDQTRRVTGVFATQVLPFFDDRSIELFRSFERLVYQQL